MNLYLIRHGEKDERTGDVSSIKLTAKGHRQADLAGKMLAGCGIEAIYSSSMKRAMQTSEEINRHLNVEIIVRSELREIDMGECDTKGWDYVYSQYPDFKTEFEKHEIDVPYPGGECGGDVWNRARQVLDEITALAFDSVAVVTHGGTIRSVICGVLGLPQERRFFFGMPPEHCGISLIKSEKNGFYLHTFNDYTHLGDEL